MKDPSTPQRSLVKSLTWRAISVIVTMILVLLFTGNVALSAIIGGFDSVIKLGAFYWHERLWHQIQWGKNNG